MRDAEPLGEEHRLRALPCPRRPKQYQNGHRPIDGSPSALMANREAAEMANGEAARLANRKAALIG
jgi:hypothetical protein